MGNRNEELADLARQAVSTAGELCLLAERMNDVGLRMYDYGEEALLATVSALYSSKDMRNVTSALLGTGVMMAMDKGNVVMLRDIAGGRLFEPDPAAWLGRFRRDGGES
ncbi:hypothetical protein [Streptomyces sp. NPDC056883]|uniref:hypothetical protein n=1 Tax=Streptomyces sp. NPDC056883 TaxID=3345959 RepID=UPI0036B45236